MVIHIVLPENVHEWYHHCAFCVKLKTDLTLYHKRNILAEMTLRKYVNDIKVKSKQP